MTDEKGNLIGAAPAVLAGMIDYQGGSVVSRTIVKKSTGTVTVFAFDKDEGLSEHTAKYEALIYIIDGTAEITISGAMNMVKAGELIMLPANEPHAVRAVERFKMLLIMIRE